MTTDKGMGCNRIDVIVRPKASKWPRFVCWLLGHRFNGGIALGWSGIVEHTCDRCRLNYHSTFDF